MACVFKPLLQKNRTVNNYIYLPSSKLHHRRNCQSYMKPLNKLNPEAVVSWCWREKPWRCELSYLIYSHFPEDLTVDGKTDSSSLCLVPVNALFNSTRPQIFHQKLMTYNDILLNICHEISIQIPHRYLSLEELNRNALLKDDISLYILRADYWSSCYSEYVKTYQKFVSSYDHTIPKSNSSFFRHETFNKGLGFSNFVKWHFPSTDCQNSRRTPIHLNTITKHLESDQ